MDEGSLPSFVGDIRDGNRDAVLDVIRWTTQKMSESQESVRSMTTFLSALDAHLKVTEEAHAETSRRLIELAGAIVGVQSATRLTVDDAKQSQRQTHRTLENMLWQLAGPGKAANQSVKDVLILVQQVEQHMAKNARLAESTAENMENMENHLLAISDHLKKLVELQSRSTRAEEAKASAKLPPPPVAPAGVNLPPATLGTAAHPVQPKLMPNSLTPPGPSGFPPAPAYPQQGYPTGPYGTQPTPCAAPCAAGGATASTGPMTAPLYKRVRLTDGTWARAEPDPDL